MTTYGDCTYCGGEVEERRIEYDYRRRGNLLVISNAPAGVCRQCGEPYFNPAVLKRMDQAYHDIFDRAKQPARVLSVPAVSLSNSRSTHLERHRWRCQSTRWSPRWRRPSR